jgi:hypothetical protein
LSHGENRSARIVTVPASRSAKWDGTVKILV